MKANRRLFIYVLALVLVLSITAKGKAIMKLNEIKPDMEGVARTVFQGYKVEEFPVKIIDIIQGDLNTGLILFRAYGEKIEEIGGIASGMSGSPVYIDGKLIGAIAYSWSLSDHRFGLITPIEDMLALLESTGQTGEKGFRGFPLNTPLYISGMQGRAFQRTRKVFENLGFQVLQGGGLGARTDTEEALEEGSAVAVQLVRGDVNIAAIGTLTYMEGGNILALGHSFTNKGEVDYLLSRAYINAIIPSISSPFKLGSPTDELIGSVTVDRNAGLAGTLQKVPRIIPLSVKVKDQERDKSEIVNVQLVKDEDYLTSLITNVSLQAIDSTLDRVGKGTARVKLKITGKGLPELGLERENVFYSRSDIAATALYELYELMNIININPFKKVELIDIKVDVEISNLDNVALIQEARILNEKIKAGDTLEIEVTLLPYRSDPVVQNIAFKLPDDINPGNASLVIDGGLTGISYQALPDEDYELAEAKQAIVEGYKDLESILKDYLARPRNNELILQVYPAYYVPEQEIEETEEEGENQEERQVRENSPGDDVIETEEKEEKRPDSDRKIREQNSYREIKEIHATDYVLEGNLVIDFNIEEVTENTAPGSV